MKRIILAITLYNLVSCNHWDRFNEMAVIRELQTINALQIQHRSQFGRLADTLAELGLATIANKDGYSVTLTATPYGYTLNANPKVFGTSGRRTFYTDQKGLIRQNWSAEPANASSPEFK